MYFYFLPFTTFTFHYDDALLYQAVRASAPVLPAQQANAYEQHDGAQPSLKNLTYNHLTSNTLSELYSMLAYEFQYAKNLIMIFIISHHYYAASESQQAEHANTALQHQAQHPSQDD